MAPQIDEVAGYKVYINPRESNHTRPHVHIEKGDFKASVALDEEATVLTASKQAGAKDLRMAKTIVKDNLERYREEWIKWRPS